MRPTHEVTQDAEQTGHNTPQLEALLDIRALLEGQHLQNYYQGLRLSLVLKELKTMNGKLDTLIGQG